ncbi:MAG: carboxypeptidase-like regulatory domain-containing protein [Candidatus Poseidoniaceae archaeon]|nr:carboxypeptidase-like regulatory domain-containing protein [Candidatus Poseidoniaceae archaeon]|tara:strand:+ start:1000 stop:3321 length:2322 start_codon:yes stop_codon:yes gene_type:complete
MSKIKAITLTLLMLCSLSLSLISAEESETFTLTGQVYDIDGNIADRTSIKVDSMTSSWSDSEGNYTFSGITPGVHTVRAYFMNNGHTVVYRTLYFDSDMELDWYEGSNWITAEWHDDTGELIEDETSNLTIELIEPHHIKSPTEGKVEFDLLPIGSYYTLKSFTDSAEQSSHYIHFKMLDNTPNHFIFQQGMNSVYGYLSDTDGEPLAGLTVSNGGIQSVTNSDGFFLFQNLPVGSTQNLTFMKDGYEVITAVSYEVNTGEGWLNLTSMLDYVFPEPARFVDSEQTISVETHMIEWISGNFTSSYHLYLDDELVYTGINTWYEFTPAAQGSYDFTLVSFNGNGSTNSPDALLLIVLGDETDEDLWSVGMSWEYKLTYMPLFEQNVTITALEKESVVDAFGVEQSVFKTRHKYDDELEGEKSYRWYDTTNLLPLRTYWRDAPFESSYFQEGTLGWDFTESNSTTPVSLFSSSDEFDLHFNRTNVIGVPGHPNGYDDTSNRVVRDYEQITTPAGTFQTTHYSMIDLNDGIVSWELWYSDTVRNFVKKVDRLPGSHSEQVVYELTSFNVPIAPQFINEAGNLSSSDFLLQWADFQGAESYTLLLGDSVLYQGNNTSFDVLDQADGTYTYHILANMPNNFQTQTSEVELRVLAIIETPEVIVSNASVNQGETVTFSWQTSEDAAWYSLLLQNELGESSEYYNGTASSVDISDLDSGLNRIRVQAGSADGKTSEYSDSVFVTVEPSSEPSDNSFFEIIFTIGVIALFGWILTSLARKS